MAPPNNPASNKGKDNKDQKKWVPRPGTGSSSSGPSIGREFDIRTPAGGKRKASAAAAGSSKKRKAGADKANKALEELVLFKEDATRPRCGRDKPRGPVVASGNRPGQAMMVIRPANASFDGKEKNMVFDNVIVWYDLASQTPHLKINLNGHIIVLHVHNFLRKSADADANPAVPLAAAPEDHIFKDKLVGGCGNPIIWTAAEIKSTLADFGCTDMNDAQIAALMKYGQGAPSTDLTKVNPGGLHFLNFTVKGRVSPPRLHQYRATHRDKNEDRALQLQRMLNTGNFIFNLVRRFGKFNLNVDAYWKHRVRVCSQQGLWAFYTDTLSARLGQRFEAWYSKPTKYFPHEPWMADGIPKKNELQKYGLHEARSNFGSLEEWEFVQSAAVLHEVSTAIKLNERYYDFRDWEYPAFVKYVEDNYVQLQMEIPRYEGLPFPDVDIKTTFYVRPGTVSGLENPGNLEKADEEMAETAEEDKDEEMVDPAAEEDKDEEMVDPAAKEVPTKVTIISGGGAKIETKVKGKGKGKQVDYASDSEDERNVFNGALLSGPIVFTNKYEIEPKSWADDAIDTWNPAPDSSKVDGGHTHRAPKEVAEQEPEPEKPTRELDLEVDESPEPGVPVHKIPEGLEWQASVIKADSNSSFTIAFRMPADKKMDFFEGGQVNVQLKIKNNFLTTQRQLQAIGMLAEKKMYNDHFGLILQRVLLGEGMTDVKESLLPHLVSLKERAINGTEYRKGMGPYRRGIYEEWLKASSLNTVQKQAYDTVVEGKLPVTIVQGPPGTGKTKTSTVTAVGIAQLDNKVLYTAPTNKAALGAFKGIVESRDLLFGIATCQGDLNPIAERVANKIKKEFGILYYPTNSRSVKDFLRMSDDAVTRELHESDINPDHDSDLDQYRIWSHVQSLYEAKSTDPDLTDFQRGQAISWLMTRKRVFKGEPILAKDKRKFVEQGIDAMAEVVNSGHIKIIVSTCNNAAALWDMGFRADASLVDEAAFGTEPDICIPLIFQQSHVVFYGDHKQLKPIVMSTGTNEYCAQLTKTCFERLIIQGNLDVIQLNLNYRMHPDIALLPGMLSYEWLGCFQKTKSESDMFRRIRDWFKTSEYIAKRRAPVFGAKPRDSIRRLFFNVPSGTSASPEDSNSKVNFANVIAIVKLCTNLMAASKIEARDISILTGYKEQREEIETMLTLVFEGLGFSTIPKVVTIDSIQGGENEFIILDITTADQFHPSFIGFIKEWNRMNVAITRAKQFLWMVGNLDAWRTELEAIVTIQRAKNFAFMIIDLLDLGDIVDMRDIPNSLPSSFNEYMTTTSKDWSRPAAQGKDRGNLNKHNLEKIKSYSGRQVAYEKNLLDKLQELRIKANKHQADHDAGRDVFLPTGGVDQNKEESAEKPDDIPMKDNAPEPTGSVDIPMEGADNPLLEDESALSLKGMSGLSTKPKDPPLGFLTASEIPRNADQENANLQQAIIQSNDLELNGPPSGSGSGSGSGAPPGAPPS